MLDDLKKAVTKEIFAAAENRFSIGDYPISDRESMTFKYRSVYDAHGKSAAHLLSTVAALAGVEIGSIMDFPCGHGRVMRALRANWPNAEIVACDLDRAGVDFCVQTFSATPLYSNHDLSLVPPPNVSAVWVGSLLTHLDKDLWPATFEFCRQSLKPGGLLLATYAGPYVAALIAEGDHNLISEEETRRGLHDFNKTGFGFMQYETHQRKYGRTIASYGWVSEFIANQTGFRPVVHFERGWAGRQSVIGLVRDDLFEETRAGA